MNKFVCQVCGYVYDQNFGDELGKIAPGVAFKDLPQDWSCPICKAEQDKFLPFG